MPQMTIYLTENLKARIEKLEGFHASRIAKEAIQEAVEKEERGERNPQGRNKLELEEREWIVRLVQDEIATAIERLRKSKEEQAVFWDAGVQSYRLMSRMLKEIPNEHFKLLVEIKDQLAPISEWFGNPCEDYCEGCASCDAWKRAIIFLTETPDSLTWGEE